MALLNPFMVKSVLETDSVDNLTLEPDTGKSILVKDIMTYPKANRYLHVTIDKTLVGFFRIDTSRLGSHLSCYMPHNGGAGYPNDAVYKKTVLGQMMEAGIFNGYPIAEGQKLVLTLDDDSNIGDTVVVYEEYEAGDITTDMQNGTTASEFVYINYGRFSTAPDKAGSFLYDDQFTPVEFPEFPFGKTVPSGKNIEINALLASERVIQGTSTGLSTTFYSFKQGRTTMFDEDLRGILATANLSGLDNSVRCEEGMSILGEGSHLYRRPVKFFDPPLVFDSGEELNVYATFVAETAGAAAISLVQSEIGLIQTVKEVS